MIEIEAKVLKAAVQEVAGVVESRNTIPVLSNILIQVEGGRLFLHGTDLDILVSRQADVVSAKKLRTTVSAKVLSGIVGKLPAEAVVTLTLSKNHLEVVAGRARFTLETLSADDFPMIATGDWLAQFEAPAFNLSTMIDRVRLAISTEETRYYLNGVFFHRVEVEGEPLLRCATTDGHRLARFSLPLPDGAEDLPNAIVPRKCIELVRRMTDKFEGPVSLAFSDTKVRFEIGQTVIVSKLIDGTFPDYSRVIPTGNDKRLAIAADSLAEAVARTQVVSTEKTRAVAVAFGRDLVTLTVRSAENGTAVEEVPCDYGAEALTIGFNAKYLLDILACFPGGDIEVELADPAAPTLVRDPKNDRLLYVIMPMRVAG
ncbi:DNA polymerase III subunit beta [Sphingosinicella sp. BN140058]|uniref:DNA polymerase III subunit beta n=1 Tax=Sphingosinicella sp. BN140058 TaxID=1892855 RepID=UPI0010116A31|nr:DNA polymerase III subunit beta [Sphingosinicella sp. BN140058]QAY77905.1 DNA polymerase III subunit beta [Sphingosinicella sp. BN140058]